MSDNVSSLLNFLDAPIMIGDPEGRVIWVNPAFENTFDWDPERVRGEALANLFDGGGREALLTAMAEVCTRGETVRFKLKKEETGYLGVASPILAEGGHVGVVILFTLEPDRDERLLAYHAEISEPLDETLRCLDELLEQTGGRRSEQYRVQVERGIASLHRAQKWSDELRGALAGERTARTSAVADPVKVVRKVAAQMATDGNAAGSTLHLLLPASLRRVAADGTMLETALLRLVRHRGAAVGGDGWLTLSARMAGEGADRRVLFSVVDRPAEGDAGVDEEPEPRLVRATIAALGGDLATRTELGVGRVTTISLALAEAD